MLLHVDEPLEHDFNTLVILNTTCVNLQQVHAIHILQNVNYMNSYNCISIFESHSIFSLTSWLGNGVRFKMKHNNWQSSFKALHFVDGCIDWNGFVLFKPKWILMGCIMEYFDSRPLLAKEINLCLWLVLVSYQLLK
jgi:hypothetical protein